MAFCLSLCCCCFQPICPGCLENVGYQFNYNNNLVSSGWSSKSSCDPWHLFLRDWTRFSVSELQAQGSQEKLRSQMDPALTRRRSQDFCHKPRRTSQRLSVWRPSLEGGCAQPRSSWYLWAGVTVDRHKSMLVLSATSHHGVDCLPRGCKIKSRSDHIGKITRGTGFASFACSVQRAEPARYPSKASSEL